MTEQTTPQIIWCRGNDKTKVPEIPDGYFFVKICIPEDEDELKALVKELETSSGAEVIVVMLDDPVVPFIALDFKDEDAARACALRFGDCSYSGPCFFGGMGQLRMVDGEDHPDPVVKQKRPPSDKRSIN